MYKHAEDTLTIHGPQKEGHLVKRTPLGANKIFLVLKEGKLIQFQAKKVQVHMIQINRTRNLTPTTF